MSLPTPPAILTPSLVIGDSISSLPVLESISIQDLESGKLDIDTIIMEVQRLKKKIPELRYEMSQYITLLASIDENTVSSSIYQELSSQILSLKNTCEAYYNSYKRILPIIRYTKIKNGLNPDDSIKIVEHKVPIDIRLLNESRTDASALSTGSILSSSQPSISSPALNMPNNGNNIATTPIFSSNNAGGSLTPAKGKTVAKTTKRRTTKKV